MKTLTVLLLCLAALPAQVIGQRNNFRNYSINEGIPQSNIFCLLQDSRSYIWLGTDGGGACRFNGRSFEIIDKSSGLAGNTVRCIYEDSRSRIWFGTDEGISVYDGLSFRTIDANDSLKGSTVLSIIEDASHNFWACSDDHGINRITLSDSTVEVRNFSVEDGLSKQVVFDAVIDKNGLMWLATFYSGIDIVSFENDSIRVKQLYEGFDIPSAMILNFEQDGTGNIWCGTYNAGAFKIELTDQPFEYNVMTFDDLDSGSVWDILVRTNGETWFGTGENGVLRIFPDQENNDRHMLEQYTVEEGLPINQILSLLEDAEGNVWLGTNGAGLCKFGGDVFSHYGEKEGLSNDNIMGLAMDNEANIWLATDGGGINKLSFLNGKPTVELLNKDDGMPSNFISCIDAGNSKNDNLWIGTSKSGIVKFNGKQFISYRETDGLKNNRVYSICVDDRGIVWIGTADGINLYDGVRFLGISMSDLKVSEDGVKSIIKDREGNIWFGTAGALARYGGDTSITTFDEEEGLATTDINCLESDGNSNIWIGTNGGGLYFFDTHTTDSLPIRHVEGNEKLGTHTLYSLAMLNDSTLIAGATNGMYRISLDAAHNITHVRRYDRTNGFKGVECNENAIFKDPLGAVWIGTTSGLTKYNPAKDHLLLIPPVVHITGLNIFFKKVDWAAESDSVSAWSNLPINLELPFSRNHLTFFFTAISFTNPDKVQYRYMLDGLDADWSPPSSESKVTFSGLPFGEYTFMVKAVNADGIWTEEPTTYHFIILPPWYRTYWFYIVCVIFIALTFYIYIKVRERKLMKEKAVLERKVRERTAEVVKQKEEIEEKNKEITDSINYASRIQNAILPLEEQRIKYLPDSFVLFKPKDIVSGDFYWMAEKDGAILFTAADCTGHGVPGAFMSMIGSALLNEVVNKNSVTKPGDVLFDVRKGIILSLKQTGEEGRQKDGMDMSLCAWRPKENIVEYAGANNSIYFIRKTGDLLKIIGGEELEPIISEGNYNLFEIKASKQPVGYYTGEDLPFENHVVSVEKGDTVYSFSDGYPDQFGGPNGKKFKYKSLKKLLLSIQDKSMSEQKEILDKTIENWRGEQEQVDDICIFAVRL